MTFLAFRHSVATSVASLPMVIGILATTRALWARRDNPIAGAGMKAAGRTTIDRDARRPPEPPARDRFESPPARDRFESEGGRSACIPPTRGGEDEATRAKLMRDLAVGFDGRQYTYAGYRYDKLEDAIRHAKLIGEGRRPLAAGA